MSPEPKERITVTLDGDLLARVDQVAEARDDSRSAMIERMLSNQIEFEEGFVKKMENPIVRNLAKLLTSSPALLDAIAVAAGDEFAAGRGSELRDFIIKQFERAKDRSEDAKSRTKKGEGPALA